MSDPIAESSRLRLAESLAVVDRHRAEFTAKMQAHLVALESESEACGQGEVTGAMLVDLLIDAASDLAACGAVSNLEPVAAEHQRLAIDGRHYSRFGIALAPLLRDTLGPSLPPQIVSAWCDAFWFTIRQLNTEITPQPMTGLNGVHVQ